jgi:hypothetical protein
MVPGHRAGWHPATGPAGGLVPVIHPGIKGAGASEIPAAKLALWLIQAAGHKEPGTKQKNNKKQTE